MKIKNIVIALALMGMLSLFLLGCKEKQGVSAIQVEYMDLSVNPGDDFYRYANGNWIKNNVMPDDRSSFGSFDIVRKKTDANVRALLDEVAKDVNAEKGSISQKIRDFYASGMDSAKIEEAGISSLKNELDLISGITTTEEFSGCCRKIPYVRFRSAFWWRP